MTLISKYIVINRKYLGKTLDYSVFSGKNNFNYMIVLNY